MEDEVLDTIDQVNEWAQNNGFLVIPPVSGDDIREILEMDLSDLYKLDIITLQSMYWKMLKYKMHLLDVINIQKSAISYCTGCINLLISDEISKMKDEMSKFDIKYANAIKKSKIAGSLNKTKALAELKITRVSDFVEHYDKYCDMLNEVIKKKNYDRRD